MLPSFPACTIYSVTLETVTDIDVGLKQPISLDQRYMSHLALNQPNPYILIQSDEIQHQTIPDPYDTELLSYTLYLQLRYFYLFSENKHTFIKQAKIWRVFWYSCLMERSGVAWCGVSSDLFNTNQLSDQHSSEDSISPCAHTAFVYTQSQPLRCPWCLT